MKVGNSGSIPYRLAHSSHAIATRSSSKISSFRVLKSLCRAKPGAGPAFNQNGSTGQFGASCSGKMIQLIGELVCCRMVRKDWWDDVIDSVLEKWCILLNSIGGGHGLVVRKCSSVKLWRALSYARAESALPTRLTVSSVESTMLDGRGTREELDIAFDLGQLDV